MTDALVATDVRKRYGDVDALAGVSLAVQAGEVFALVGPNGAGKTTLVRALTGTTTPDDGDVSLLGTEPVAADPEVLGVLPQSFSPPERLTGREVVAYYAGLYDDARPVDDVLAAVGVMDAADTHYEDLSGGEQRRVCLGSTLVNDPDVLFLDEPTTGIDPTGRRTVWDRVDEQVASGTTVFLTTHDMREAQRLADRVGLLADGELVAVGEPDALIATHAGAPSVVISVGGTASDDDDDAVGVVGGTASDDDDAVGSERDGSESNDGGADATEAAVAALAGAGYDATSHDSEVRVSGVAAREVGAVADALDDAGVPFSGLAWSEPDLEDVYLELTGEAYEDHRGTGRTSAAGPADGGASS